MKIFTYLTARKESTQTQEGVNYVVRFSQFSREQAQALFAKAVPELPRSGNSTKKEKRNNGHENFKWKYLQPN